MQLDTYYTSVAEALLHEVWIVHVHFHVPRKCTNVKYVHVHVYTYMYVCINFGRTNLQRISEMVY